MSYFAKPNFIVYDDWFDYDIENKLDFKNKQIKTITNMHEFFYEQSNYKIGASENNLKLDIKVNKKELITNNYLVNTSEKYTSLSKNLTEKTLKRKLKFNITKKLIYSLSIFGFVFIFGFFLFFITQPEKNESKIMKKSIGIEKNI